MVPHARWRLHHNLLLQDDLLLQYCRRVTVRLLWRSLAADGLPAGVCSPWRRVC